MIVATDDERIAAPVRAAGGEAMMTSPTHAERHRSNRRGRIKVVADIYLGVQGDQPFIAPADLDALAAAMRADESIRDGDAGDADRRPLEWTDPNKVKVVCDADGNALYFSRSPIPHARDGGMPKEALRHIGVYAYRRDFLMKFAAPSEWARWRALEKLEQLRALEHGYVIRVVSVGGAVARSRYRGGPGARPRARRRIQLVEDGEGIDVETRQDQIYLRNRRRGFVAGQGPRGRVARRAARGARAQASRCSRWIPTSTSIPAR